jgi:hypothetical protein
MTQLGILIAFLQAGVLAIAFFQHPRRHLPFYGWVGLVGLLSAEGLLFGGVRPVGIYFTPIAWTCYILLADAAVFAIRGHSRLHDRAQHFARLALLSIPLWLIFEAYNLRLRNWTYAGVPQTWPLALLGYAWSFATITPAIFETADLIESFGWFPAVEGIQFSWGFRGGMILSGAICLLLPLLVPQAIARRLFLLVWIGFVFLLDPINYHLGLPSLLGDFQRGRRSRFYALLISGSVCGWFWEFWNYWAAAKWYYIFPMFQRFKVFEMPIPGYLGFFPFALECFVMYVTSAAILRLLNRNHDEWYSYGWDLPAGASKPKQDKEREFPDRA